MPWLVAYTPIMFWFLVVILVLSYHLCSLDAENGALELCNAFAAEDLVALCRRCRLSFASNSGDRGPAPRCILGFLAAVQSDRGCGSWLAVCVCMRVHVRACVQPWLVGANLVVLTPSTLILLLLVVGACCAHGVGRIAYI